MADEVRLNIRITEAQKKKLQKEASDRGLTLSAYVRMTLLSANNNNFAM